MILRILLALVVGVLLYPHQPTEEIFVVSQETARETPQLATKYEELPSLEYNFKPPLGNAYRFAYGNCTYGVASWTAVPVSGNANQWDDNARALGYTVTNNPVVGAVGVDNSGYLGHVVLILEVDGSRVYLKEMNYTGFNRVSYRWASASDFTYIMF